MVAETHRGRATWNAPATEQLLNRHPDLRLCADLSHWCCVHESLLDRLTQPVAQALQRSDLIHARVGYSQGPQVPHWRAPEWQTELDAHLSWWDDIVAHHHSRDTADDSAAASDSPLIICPEFGPAPYQPLVPFTGLPVSDNWELNFSMMEMLRQRYAAK